MDQELAAPRPRHDAPAPVALRHVHGRHDARPQPFGDVHAPPITLDVKYMTRFPALKELEPIGAQFPCVLVVELAAIYQTGFVWIIHQLYPSLNTLRRERNAINIAVPLMKRRIAGAGIEVDFRLHLFTRTVLV